MNAIKRERAGVALPFLKFAQIIGCGGWLVCRQTNRDLLYGVHQDEQKHRGYPRSYDCFWIQSKVRLVSPSFPLGTPTLPNDLGFASQRFLTTCNQYKSQVQGGINLNGTVPYFVSS